MEPGLNAVEPGLNAVEPGLNAQIGIVLKCPDYEGVLFSGVELSVVTWDLEISVLFIEVSLFQEVHI